VNDLARVQQTDDELLGVTEGRHAIDEDALLTPIFAALRRGSRRRSHTERSWTGGRDGHEPAREVLRDPVDEFHRDPLTAPIPMQSLVPAPSRSTERSSTAHHSGGRTDRGRHHLERAGSAR